MKRRVVAIVLLGGLLCYGTAHAFYLDGDTKSLQITGKVFSQASLRTEDSDSSGLDCYPFGESCDGFTFPDTRAGNLIQHRNLLDLEFYHNVGKTLGPEFDLLDQFAYRLRVKWFYDGVWDYGGNRFSEPKTALGTTGVPPLDAILQQGLIDNRRKVGMQKDPLWNAYIDAGRGRLKFRVGRQDLSWGESDGFRLLDHIQPLDSRFGFPLVEDLDDRRIPLWMVRPTLSIGTVGPLSNLTLDGYWVPGTIDNQVSPSANPGNPFGTGAPPGSSFEIRPHKNLGNSRGGGRLLGTVGPVTFSLAHYVTFNDYPSVRLRATDINVLPIGAPDALPNFLYFSPNGAFAVEYYQQQITGGSATFALPFDPYTIVRMEMANFWDEHVFKPSASVNAAVERCAAQLVNQGGVGTCPTPGLGDRPTKNVLRWMIGLDRNVWIRWLNPQNTFYLSAQYFHTNILNYDREISNALPTETNLSTIANVEIDPVNLPGVTVPLKATGFHFSPRKNDEMIFTYFANTLYRHGTIQPGVFGMYDTRGVHAVVPSLTYQWGTNVQLTVKYAVIFGTYANLGFFRDRDQLLFRVQYNLS